MSPSFSQKKKPSTTAKISIYLVIALVVGVDLQQIIHGVVLHGNELSSSSSSSSAKAPTTPSKVFTVAVATVQVVAAKVVGVVAKSPIAVDSRVARTARAVVDVVDVAKVVVVAVDVVGVVVVTTIYTGGAVVEQLAVARSVLVEHERTAGEIVHRFGPRLGRRVQVEERRLAVLEPVGMGHKLAPSATTGHAVLGRRVPPVMSGTCKYLPLRGSSKPELERLRTPRLRAVTFCGRN